MDNTHKVLAILMKDQGLNQVELTRATGIPQSTISRILNPGAVNGIKLPSDTQVRLVAAFFGVSTDQLRGYKPLAIDHANLPPQSDRTSVSCPLREEIATRLQKIQDPEILKSIGNIVSSFVDGRISLDDAKMIEVFSLRLSNHRHAIKELGISSKNNLTESDMAL